MCVGSAPRCTFHVQGFSVTARLHSTRPPFLLPFHLMDCLEHQKTYYSNSLISKAPVQCIKISGDESALLSPPTRTEVFFFKGHQRERKKKNLGQQQQKEQHKEPWRNFLKSELGVFCSRAKTSSNCSDMAFVLLISVCFSRSAARADLLPCVYFWHSVVTSRFGNPLFFSALLFRKADAWSLQVCCFGPSPSCSSGPQDVWAPGVRVAGLDRRLWLKTTPRCGASCSRRRTDSVGAWSSSPPRWDVGAQPIAMILRYETMCYSRLTWNCCKIKQICSSGWVIHWPLRLCCLPYLFKFSRGNKHAHGHAHTHCLLSWQWTKFKQRCEADSNDLSDIPSAEAQIKSFEIFNRIKLSAMWRKRRKSETWCEREMKSFLWNALRIFMLLLISVHSFTSGDSSQEKKLMQRLTDCAASTIATVTNSQNNFG